MACDITYKSVESGIRSKIEELVNNSDNFTIVDGKVQSIKNQDIKYQLSKEQSDAIDNAFDENPELKDKITKLLPNVQGIYKTMFPINPLQSLYEIAIQAHSSEGERQGAVNVAGEEMVKLAEETYPNAKVGNSYKSYLKSQGNFQEINNKFTEKVIQDNGEIVPSKTLIEQYYSPRYLELQPFIDKIDNKVIQEMYNDNPELTLKYIATLDDEEEIANIGQEIYDEAIKLFPNEETPLNKELVFFNKEVEQKDLFYNPTEILNSLYKKVLEFEHTTYALKLVESNSSSQKGIILPVSLNKKDSVERISEVFQKSFNKKFGTIARLENAAIYGVKSGFIIRLRNPKFGMTNDEIFDKTDVFTDLQLTEFIKDIATRLGIEHKIVTKEEITKLLNNLGYSYNNEPGLTLNGIVYYVQGQVGSFTAIHELFHPFIQYVRLKKPELYDKLIKDIKRSDDPLIKNIISLVDEKYGEQTSVEHSDELLVRVAQTLSQDKKETINEKQKSIWEQIQYLFKKFLRWFGNNNENKKVDISKLNTNTSSVQDIVNLFYNPQFTANLTSEVANDVGIFWNRINTQDLTESEMKEFVNNYIENIGINGEDKWVSNMEKRINQLKKEDFYNVSDINKVMDENQVTDKNPIFSAKNSLDNLVKAVKNKEVEKYGVEFGRMIYAIEATSENLLTTLKNLKATLSSTQNQEEKEQLNTVILRKAWAYKSTIIKSYGDMIKDAEAIFDKGENANMSEKLTKIAKAFRVSEAIIDEFLQDSVVSVIKNNTQIFNSTIIELNDAITKTKEAIAAAKSKGQRTWDLDSQERYLNRCLNLIPQTEKDFLNLAKGGKEVGLFTMLAESFLNNPSLTVTTLGIEFSKAFNQMNAISQTDSLRLWNKIIEKSKSLGVDATKFDAFHSDFTHETTTLSYVEGVPTKHTIYEMIHETNTSEAQAEQFLLKDKSNKSKEELNKDKENKEKRLAYITAEREYLRFTLKYMNDKLPSENIKARLFWMEDSPQFTLEEKLLASKERVDKYKDLQDAMDNDEIIGTDESELNLFQAQRAYSNLYAEVDENGLPKTGIDLKIAQIFKEYREKYKNLETFEFTPLVQKFEKEIQEHLDVVTNLQDKLNKEANNEANKEIRTRIQIEIDDATKKANTFIKRNVNIGATKLFYDSRTEITENLNDVQIKLNELLGLKDQLNLKESWKKIIELTSEYRNNERVIAVNLISQDKKQLIIEFLRDIEDLKQQFKEEKFEIVKSLTDTKLNEYRKLKDEMLTYINQLSEIQTTEPTLYYLEELKKQYGVLGTNEEITFDNIDDFTNYDFIQKLLKTGLATPNTLDENSRKKQFEANIGKKVSVLYQSQRQKLVSTEASWRPMIIESVGTTQFTAFELNDKGEKVGIEKTFNLNDRLVAYEFDNDIQNNNTPEYQAANQFTTWFLNNHMLTKQYDKDTKKFTYNYKKLYIWGQNVPTAEISTDYILADAIKANDYISMWHTFKSKLQDGKRIENGLMFELKPKGRFQRKDIRNETEKIEGVTVDNKGNWLPKNVEQLKGGIGDDKFINQKYADLKKNNTELFELLQLFTEFHLENQKEALYNQKLYMQMPRMAKSRAEIVNDPLAWWDNVKFNIQELFNQMPDEQDDNNTQPTKNYSLKTLVSNTFNKVSGKGELVSQSQKMQKYIPAQNVGMLELKNTSTNFSDSLFQYAYSNNLNVLRNNQLPIFEAFKNSMEKAGNGSGNNTYDMINGFQDIFIYGINNKYEIGRSVHKIAFAMMKPMLFSSLSLLNLPSNIKNVATANLANRLKLFLKEAGITKDNMLEADGYYFTNMTNIIKDAWSSHGYSLPTTIAKVFQFNGKAVNVKYKGNNVLNSFKDASFMGSGQNAGEEMASYQLGFAMLASIKVNQKIKNENGDEMIKHISYLKAFELDKDGNIKLLDGIDEEMYGIKSKLFVETVNKMKVFQAQSQGQYGILEKTIGSTYTIGAVMRIMRKYLVPQALENFQSLRVNATFGTVKRGNFIEFGKQIGNVTAALVNGHSKEYWDTLTITQKGGVYKTVANLVIVGLLGVFISLLGFDPDDRDKWKKLREQSTLINMLLLEAIMLKSEMESFIPIPGMGTDELGRQFSLGAPQRYIKKYISLLNHAIHAFDESGYYKTKSGLFDKGESKLKVDLLKMFYFKSWQQSPEQAIKDQLLIQRQ